MDRNILFSACRTLRSMLAPRSWFVGVLPVNIDGGFACQVSLTQASDDTLRCVPSEVHGVPVALKLEIHQ